MSWLLKKNIKSLCGQNFKLFNEIAERAMNGEGVKGNPKRSIFK